MNVRTSIAVNATTYIKKIDGARNMYHESGSALTSVVLPGSHDDAAKHP